ncbi:MAG: sulfatase [Lentisphaerae bacterium]|nr:sulfatase [Lentisphaerota bacterium]MBT4819801.1 sulfatase [Lentisphaerota bacterium]MBT5607755.1 sulfatase [Lentisphaerota bacterium]MBT7054918.1 sulfatase [Lentisphaerota bacterium]MBT7843312.1 sulfatase [Lentisphaerota bacterium]
MSGRDVPERPNIILINCDDLGYGDIGCYGSELHTTPAVDRLAEEGMRFTDFYMAAPMCSPSRAAMMTGCYPQRIGLETGCEICVLRPGEPNGLSQNEVTVAELLEQAGYATEIIGKWHLGDQPEFLPTRHGFGAWYGLPYSNDMGRTARNPHFPPLPLMRDEDVMQEQPDQSALTERYVEEAVRFIRDHRESPFFLYLAHMYVHVPLYAPDRFMKQSRNGKYGAAVEHVDWSVAVLLDELARLDIEGNTLVIFTSDNGGATQHGASNAPLRGRKGQTWEGGIRVPCVMRWPNAIPAGTECEELATAMDFLPTFARLAGVGVPTDRLIDGKDMGPLMQGGAEKSGYDAFFYYREMELQAVRSGDWKLHLQSGELYNLREDVGESRDRAAAEPGIVATLEAHGARVGEDLGDSLTGEEGANRRPCGRVENPKPLTVYRDDHPYIVALYD